jgi:transcriptional regulator with XRE-family HTH domain
MALNAGEVEVVMKLRDEASAQLATFKDKLKEFGGITGEVMLAAAAAVIAVTASIVALADHGSQINDVRDGFTHLAGGIDAADAIMTKMRDGTKGTITNFDLMTDATKLLSTGVKISSEDFGTLSEAALVLSHRGFGSVKDILDAVNDAMITGKTKGVSLMLGVVDQTAAEHKYAESLGVGVESLSSIDKAEAHRQAVLEMSRKLVADAGEQHLTFAENIEHAKAAVQNWVDALASSVAESPAVMGALNAIEDAVKTAFGGDSQTLLDEVLIGINSFADAVKASVPYVVSFAREVRDVVQTLYDSRAAIEVVAAALVGYGAGILLSSSYVVAANTVSKIYTATMALLSGEMTVAASATNVFALAVGALLAGYALGKWLEENTSWARELSDAFEYASLRLQGYSAAQADAMIAQDHAAEAAIKHNKGLTDQQRALEQVGAVAGTTTDKIDGWTQSNTKAATAAEKHEADIYKIVDALTSARQQADDVDAAWQRLSASQKADIDVLQALEPMVDKLVASHQHVSEALKAAYAAALDAKLGLTAEGVEMLKTQGVTLSYIDTLKLQGISQQEIATKLGVTIGAMAQYETQLRDMASFTAESLKTSQQLWDEWAAVIEKDLITTAYGQAKLAIQDWLRSQVQALDAWEKVEKEKYPLQTAMIENEYQNRLIAYKAIEAAKLDQLDKDTARADTTSKAYYDRQAQMAADTFADYKAHSDIHTEREIENARKVADALKLSADYWQPWSAAGTSAAAALTAAVTATSVAVGSLAMTTVTASGQQVAAIATVTQGYYAEVDAAMAAMTAATDGMTAAVGHRAPYLDPRTGKWVDEGAAGGSAAGAGGSFSAGGGATDLVVRALIGQGYTLGEAAAIAGGYGVSVGAPTRRDSGGPVQAGRPYLIGTGAQPELFTPASDGTMTPGGGSRGGMTAPVVLVVDGREFARVLVPLIPGELRRIGVA